MKTKITKLLFYLSVLLSLQTEAQSVFLPFSDDFSSYTGQPDTSLWQNAGCFVNTGFQYFPPTVGVVTLDILNSEGVIYPQANTYSFAADTLTSVAIRMDSVKEPSAKKLLPSDSVCLSFFIQPGGAMGNMWERIGCAPSVKDSVILQFYKAKQDTWNTVWYINGTCVDSVYYYDSAYFIYVTVPVDDIDYFTDNFRFRFINYGSLDANPSYSYVSNSGQWNIDYIYLNHNRSVKDNSFRDIAFVNPASSLLKNFTALPANHFKKEYMKDSLEVTIANLYSSTLNSNYFFTVTDTAGNLLHQYSGGFENIASYPQTHSFQTAQHHARPELNFSLNPPKNTQSKYRITHVVSEGVGQDNIRNNDTIQFVQIFGDYFAYDDGTSEAGIGIEPTNSSAFAMGFPLLQHDTLYAVDIYFNSTYKDSNLKPFVINICTGSADSVPVPDQVIYSTDKLMPDISGLNKFTRYVLDSPVSIPQGTFFITVKAQGNIYMNIGFDQNNDARGYMFEKKQNSWEEIFLKGAAMIRPHFGYKSVGTDVIKKDTVCFNVMPNPAKDRIYIEYPMDEPVSIFDQNGRLVKSCKQKTADIHELTDGIYFIKYKNQVKKLIKVR